MRKTFFSNLNAHQLVVACPTYHLPLTSYHVQTRKKLVTRIFRNVILLGQKRGESNPLGACGPFTPENQFCFFFTCTATRLPVPIQASLLWLGQRHLRQQSGRAYRLKRHYQHRYITTGMAVSESPLSGRIQGKWWADGQFEGRIPMKLNPKTKRE